MDPKLSKEKEISGSTMVDKKKREKEKKMDGMKCVDTLTYGVI